MADVTPKNVKVLGQDGQWYSIIGPAGPQGPPGPGINMLGSLKTEADLKTKEQAGGLNKGDAYMTEDDGFIHVWDGTKFVNTKIQGKQGPAGPAGRSLIVFPPSTTEPAKASDVNDPTKDKDKAHAGDFWIIPGP